MLTSNDKKEIKNITDKMIKDHEHKQRSVTIRKATLNITMEVVMEGPEDIDTLRAKALDTFKKMEGTHPPDDLMSFG